MNVSYPILSTGRGGHPRLVAKAWPADCYGPVPDAQAQRHWSAALDQYQQAATDCEAGVAGKNQALITKVGTDSHIASGDLDLATARIMRIINGAA
ncbi:hypothetical protein ACEZDB_18940 [Streptacidiphilus sp. N1-3]|uniref:Uncharacterized protein n=1 Tax=Streptacidiphilus alkalitolerans TaxID=3342712 RepID=A0ABV6X350_9ACTN